MSGLDNELLVSKKKKNNDGEDVLCPVLQSRLEFSMNFSFITRQ